MPATVVLVTEDAAEATRELVERARDESWSVVHVIGVDDMRRAIGSTPVSLLLVESVVWDREKFRQLVGREWPTLPVIILTGGDEPTAKLVEHLKLGAAHYIPRRSSAREFRATIRAILDLASRNPHRELVRPYLHSGRLELRLDNELNAVAVATGFVQNLMEAYHIGEPGVRVRLGIALSEALSNAIIHGNLEVSSDLRESGNDDYFTMIEARQRQEPYASRRVALVVSCDQHAVTFVVRDEGPGFNVNDVADPTDPENLLKPCGRGLLMMRAYTDDVRWNEAGNEVVMVKKIVVDGK